MLISGCGKEESPSSPEAPATTRGSSLAKGSSEYKASPDIKKYDYRRIAEFVHQHNIGQGAIFLEPSPFGFGVFVPVADQAGGGAGQFLTID